MKTSPDHRLQAVAVIGAAGKMGCGIAWTALQAMARLDAEKHGVPGSGKYDLALIDNSREGLARLKAYLETQLLKFAEKRIIALRQWAADRRDLVDNAEIIEAYVKGALSLCRYETTPDGAKGARLVFEAIFEDVEVKKKLFTRLKEIADPEAWYLTNTSAIPISLLDAQAGLKGRILGYHFYNPPAVQKLVEVITPKQVDPALAAYGAELGALFEKILVPSGDTAGFIGNGHFMRDGLFAFARFRELRESLGDAEALYAINKVTQDVLIRPMGIFQLIDYVGIEVFRMVLQVMQAHIPGESFRCEEVDRLLAAEVKGGQLGSGEQKDGMFKYEKNRMTAVYDLKAGAYAPLSEKSRFEKANAWIGLMPHGQASWNTLVKDPARKEKLKQYFAALRRHDSNGATLAKAFLDRTVAISDLLVDAKVAAGREDVGKVLMNGFYHLYGPAEWMQNA